MDGRAAAAQGRRASPTELAVAHQHLVARRERAREPLDEIDRAVPAAGAADRDRQVVAVVARVVGQPARDEAVDVPVHPLDVGHRFEERDHRGVAPGERLQRRLVVRIGQAAHVEHESASSGTPCLKPNDSNSSVSLVASTLMKSLIQARSVGGGRFAGVDARAERAHVGEQRALVLDRFGQRARRRWRTDAAGASRKSA